MVKHSIQNFSVCFDKPVVDGKSTFLKGDMVTGRVSFDLSKDTSITSIRMKLRGGADVGWTGGTINNRRNFSARVDFFTLESTILQNTRETTSSGQDKLPAGTHVFPFSCQLPVGDFPSSFRGTHGEIKYTLTVTIDRPWHLSKDFVTELDFVNHIDNSKPDLWAPLSGSNSKMLCCLCCASGPVTMTVMVEKAIFSPGETAKIFCEFSNASSKAASPWVKLLQRQTVYTLDQVSSSQACERLALVAGEHVMPYTSDVHTEIKLHIPSSASCTISNISILKVEYIIEVSLCILGSHELTVLFPIILCDKSTYNPPPFLSSLPVGVAVSVRMAASRRPS